MDNGDFQFFYLLTVLKNRIKYFIV